MIVNLTDQEVFKAKRVASLRSGAKSYLDSRENRSSSNPSSYDRHFLGVRAEMAVAKLFHTSIDETFNWGDKNNPDVYLPDGRSVQVKSKFKDTKDSGFQLRSKNIEDFKADLGILCKETNKISNIEIIGWFDKQTFIDNSFVKSFSWQDVLYLDVKHISSIDKLQSQIKKKHLQLSRPKVEKIFTSVKTYLQSNEFLKFNKTSYDREDIKLIIDTLENKIRELKLIYGGFMAPPRK